MQLQFKQFNAGGGFDNIPYLPREDFIIDIDLEDPVLQMQSLAGEDSYLFLFKRITGEDRPSEFTFDLVAMTGTYTYRQNRLGKDLDCGLVDFALAHQHPA